jgi:hypothetical protein
MPNGLSASSAISKGRSGLAAGAAGAADSAGAAGEAGAQASNKAVVPTLALTVKNRRRLMDWLNIVFSPLKI